MTLTGVAATIGSTLAHLYLPGFLVVSERTADAVPAPSGVGAEHLTGDEHARWAAVHGSGSW